MAKGPEASPSLRLATVCIDCADADVMADFYGRLLGWEVTLREPGWVLMRDPAGGTGLSFQAEPGYRAPVWPEQPGAKDKMLHFEIEVDDLDDAILLQRLKIVLEINLLKHGHSLSVCHSLARFIPLQLICDVA